MNKQRRLRRWLIAAYITGAVLCILAFVIWLVMPSPEMRGEIAKLKMHGEPWDLADFAQPQVPPEENAALVYCQAGEKLRTHSSDEEILRRTQQLPLDPKDMASIDDLIGRNAELLRLARRASDMPKVRWDYPIEEAQFKLSPEEDLFDKIPFYKMRQMAVIIRLAALRAHEQSNELEALRHVSSLLHLARAVRKIPNLRAFSTAAGIERDAINVIQEISWDLQLTAQGETEERSLTVRLIRELLNDQEMIHDYQWQLYGQRTLDYYKTNQKLLMDRNARGVAEVRGIYWAYASAVARSKTLPEAQLIPKVSLYTHKVGDGILMTSAQIQQELRYENYAPLNIARAHFVLLADRRMAAVALAIRLYVIDHGQRPNDLNALVKEGYIGAIPRDPLATNAPIHYIPDGEHPRLYSFGRNGTDENGSLEMPEYYASGFLRHATKDQPFFLDRPIEEVDPPSYGGYGGGYGYGGPDPTTLPESAASQPK